MDDMPTGNEPRTRNESVRTVNRENSQIVEKHTVLVTNDSMQAMH